MVDELGDRHLHAVALGNRFKVDASPVQALPVITMDPEAMAHADRPADGADVIGVGGPLCYGGPRSSAYVCYGTTNTGTLPSARTSDV